MSQAAAAAPEQKPQAPTVTMPEAGFAMNVRMLDKHGQEVQLTFRCALVSQAGKLIDNYERTVDTLIEQGWRPSQPRPAGQASGGAQVSGDAPKCKYHSRPMKPSKKPGSFFCPAKADTDSGYCDYKIEGGQG